MCCAGARQPGANDGVVAQRRVDGDGGSRGLRQVLAVQHEQRQDVPRAQGGSPRHQVDSTS